MNARPAVLGLVLFALYLTAVGTPGLSSAEYAGDEPRHLRAAAGLASGEGAAAAPRGIGFPLLIAPAHAVAGPTGVEVWLAAIAALGFAAAAAVAGRVVSEPWATGGTAAVGVSAPAVAYGTTVYPDLAAGAALAGAVLVALRVRRSRRLADAVWGGVLLAVLPWLGPQYALPGLVVLVALTVWLLRERRSIAAVLAVEVVAASAIAYVSVNDTLYGRLTPYEGAGLELDRLTRLGTLWLDPRHGMLRWAPVVALAAVGIAALWRSWRSRISRVVPERREAEAAAGLCAAVCLAVFATAVLVAPSDDGEWFGPRHLIAALPCASVLVAWGLQRLPRVGTALAVGGGLLSFSLVAALRFGWADGWVETSWPL